MIYNTRAERNETRKIKERTNNWILAKTRGEGRGEEGQGRRYRCGRPLTIFYTVFPVAEAARDSDTLRFTSAAATCPNLIYPGPLVAITTGGNPRPQLSPASSTRVNNTPARVLIFRYCKGVAVAPRIIASNHRSIGISRLKSHSDSIPRHFSLTVPSAFCARSSRRRRRRRSEFTRRGKIEAGQRRNFSMK